jgi:hypothetical protein
VTISVLDRETYSEAEAARLLRVPQSTLNYWLEGGRRGSKIQPDLRFGKPAVGGISTEVVREHADSGEDEDAFDLSLSNVRWALSYETARRAA